ncbi:hypothetical protein BKA70DRAFT_255147 [Coprinopsis sp. MPI-PUGE-AT-0042]|nr:hypothetical protein BKA70DRAFT_255147 [Coprinopsis sp. MPI-PUGE-AT-0042]
MEGSGSEFKACTPSFASPSAIQPLTIIAMTPDSRLDPYAHSNNEPLPDHLHHPLYTFLDQLDQQTYAFQRGRQPVEEAIADRQSRILALQSEVERLKPVRERLLTAEALVSARKTPYAVTLSALRRTPPEIIARIIAFAISDPKRFVGKAGRRTFQSVSTVCRLWRETAFSTPYLWRSVEVVEEDFPFRSLVSWCSRGGDGAPIRLSFSQVLAIQVTYAFSVAHSSNLNLTSVIVTVDGDGDPYDGSDELNFLAPLNGYQSSTTSSTSTCDSSPLQDIQIQLQCPRHWEANRSTQPMAITRHLPHLSTMLLSF